MLQADSNNKNSYCLLEAFYDTGTLPDTLHIWLPYDIVVVNIHFTYEVNAAQNG